MRTSTRMMSVPLERKRKENTQFWNVNNITKKKGGGRRKEAITEGGKEHKYVDINVSKLLLSFIHIQHIVRTYVSRQPCLGSAIREEHIQTHNPLPHIYPAVTLQPLIAYGGKSAPEEEIEQNKISIADIESRNTEYCPV